MPYTETAAELFDRLPALLASAPSSDLGKPVRFDISGTGGGVWTVDFKAQTVCAGRTPAPVAAIVGADERDFMALVEGRMSASDGLVTGRLKLAGEAAALATLMEAIAALTGVEQAA